MKTFLTEKHNIPEGATHYRDETNFDSFAWYCDGPTPRLIVDGDVRFGYQLAVSGENLNSLKPIPQTNIETPEEKEVFDSMKQRNDQSEINKPSWAKWSIGDSVTKTKGSSWTGKVVGYYSTSLTSKGYAVESETEKGSVQIYPEAALCSVETEAERVERERLEAAYCLYVVAQESLDVIGYESFQQFTDDKVQVKFWLAIVDKTNYRMESE